MLAQRDPFACFSGASSQLISRNDSNYVFTTAHLYSFKLQCPRDPRRGEQFIVVGKQNPRQLHLECHVHEGALRAFVSAVERTIQENVFCFFLGRRTDRPPSSLFFRLSSSPPPPPPTFAQLFVSLLSVAKSHRIPYNLSRNERNLYGV